MSVFLEADAVTTELPNPQLSNVEQLKSTLTLLRSRTGVKYTYVKRRSRKRLLWAFQLTREKAFELKHFLLTYYGSHIKLTDHTGQAWTATLKSNPAEFQTIGRDAINKEAISVTLEFEATEIA